METRRPSRNSMGQLLVPRNQRSLFDNNRLFLSAAQKLAIASPDKIIGITLEGRVIQKDPSNGKCFKLQVGDFADFNKEIRTQLLDFAKSFYLGSIDEILRNKRYIADRDTLWAQQRIIDPFIGINWQPSFDISPAVVLTPNYDYDSDLEYCKDLSAFPKFFSVLDRLDRQRKSCGGKITLEPQGKLRVDQNGFLEIKKHNQRAYLANGFGITDFIELRLFVLCFGGDSEHKYNSFACSEQEMKIIASSYKAFVGDGWWLFPNIDGWLYKLERTGEYTPVKRLEL